ncbi:lipoprotein-releasing system ATP-binding protein [Flavobacterium nitrogenifigens]|uniref:Lipoprotein-releasing system ATP-binding protein n=2 Tax=Flavobacterium TaxID=237 RepID=A0A7W7IX66_9FLAO|nr:MULTISPECIES: ABC transporter ATP-binding protein [Flavobacterium]MBB4802132.1 lipoprotein-releasing system ATP-binding protein [Flavobacterium nitrogenifigens]MBB6387090.1 lipoprotein-releasing system ATP-binding protein [Flavobacterium notoginsengisoli]
MNIALRAENISKYFTEPDKFKVLKEVSFEIHRGEFVSIIGKSGSGKSTLLYILSTMDTDYEGTLDLNGEKITGRNQNSLAAFRNENLGFVFQFHYLLPDFSCLRNVMIPALRLGILSKEEIEYNAYEKLKMLGMDHQALKSASKVSGGQQQRVAIARALINEPSIIMGDEPTGNLDSKNTAVVFDIFKELAIEHKKTIITVTHDNDFAAKSDRIIEMQDGKIISL